MENTFICLLPCEEDAARLHQTFDALFSLSSFAYIKLPLHVTLYFFSGFVGEKNTDVLDWVRNASAMSTGAVVADIENIRAFKKKDRDFVYYLPIFSERIIHLHADLYQNFKHIHTDPFEFVSHLSLFYSDRTLHEKEKESVQKIYEEIKSITFDRVSFAAEKENGIHFIDVQTL